MTSQDRPDPFYGDAARQAGGASWLGPGLGRGHRLGAADDAFAYQGDPAGVRRWAEQHGWVRTDEAPPVVAEILEAAPVPLGPEYVASDVITGQFEGWDALAYNVGVQTSNGVVPKWAMTAVGRSQAGSGFWVHPKRLGRFRRREQGVVTAKLDFAELADRWTLSTNGTEGEGLDLLENRSVVHALLETDDGDELWATPTAFAAVRPDNHRPALLDHHLRLLTTLAKAEPTGRASR